MLNRRRWIIAAPIKEELLRLGLWISDASRRMPIFVDATSGVGKSRFLGRGVSWQDLIMAVPLVIFDPHGVTIANLLDKITRLPEEVPLITRKRLWRRIRYVDMSGASGYVIPFPLYYRLGDETLYSIAYRFVDTIRKVDPHLQTASIEGFNAFRRVATNVGMLLAATGGQITDAAPLLRQPEPWLARARAKADAYGGELDPAIAFLAQYAADKRRHQRTIGSFLNKVDQFELDPALRAVFGPDEPGIDWEEVVDKRLAVLLDFSRIDRDSERRQFLMMWAYQYLMSYIYHRGAGRHQPISLIVDELAALFPMSGLVADQFAADVDEMINQIARNYSLWVTLATQELYQFSERLQKTLLSMTLIQGRTSDPEAAGALAQRLSRYHPYWVKKRENVWLTDMFSNPYVVEQKPVEFTPEEQLILQSYRFMDLKKFEFLVRAPRSEGDMAGGVKRITIAPLDPGQFPDEELVARAQKLLLQRDGRKVEDVLAEIQARLEEGTEAAKRLEAKGQQMEQPAKRPSIPASGDFDPL